MGKLVELPDDLWAMIEQEARARQVQPAELLRDFVERFQYSELNELLRARGRTSSHPRSGPCQVTSFPRMQTRDGSLVSEQIVQDRI